MRLQLFLTHSDVPAIAFSRFLLFPKMCTFNLSIGFPKLFGLPWCYVVASISKFGGFDFFSNVTVSLFILSNL